jgi:LysR family glycine cleavage system transcriptional activator
MSGRRLLPLTGLRAFEAASRHLSFQAAADELGVTPTAISHQVRALETLLGVALFIRRTRRVSLSDAGAELFGSVRKGFDILEKSVANVSPNTRRKVVTLTAPVHFTARRLIPMLHLFQQRHPGLDLKFHASDEIVDLPSGAADVGVRCGQRFLGGLVTEPLLRDQYGPLCSPLLAVSSATDVSRAVLIHSEHKLQGHGANWRDWCELARVTDENVDAGVRFNDEGHAIQAAVAGHGVVLASLMLAQAELESGMLIQPCGPLLEGDTYYVVATPAMTATQEVAAVRDWLRVCLAS